MASIKEIRTHIRSVEQTLKITNAMYLISSANLRKARAQLNNVEPYFRKIESTISDILHHSPEIVHPFFDKRPEISPEKRKVGYIVVTGDKGLAGAYNHNILKLAEGKLARHPGASLFVVGQVGRSYFQEHSIPIDVEFLYTAQNPTVPRARDIAESMMDLFPEGSLTTCTCSSPGWSPPLTWSPPSTSCSPWIPTCSRSTRPTGTPTTGT